MIKQLVKTIETGEKVLAVIGAVVLASRFVKELTK